MLRVNIKVIITVFLYMLVFNIDESLFASPPEKTARLSFPSRVNFVENKNQWEDFIRYEADFKGGKIFLEDNRFTYLFYHPGDMRALHPHEGKRPEKIRLHALKVHAFGANPNPSLKADNPAKYCNNYFIGNDPAKWASNAKLFSSVTYGDLYNGIDLKFYSTLSDIKYDLIVKPGANADDIALEYEGADDISLRDGKLVLKLSVGDIVEQNPYAYQVINGKETEVSCKFILKKNKISFRFPHGYNKSYPLIIDPTVIFASYTGSNADNWGFTATYDTAGNVYAGGNVNDFGYPVTPGAFQVLYAGGGFGGNGWACDMAIAKFNSTGTTLLFATYLGGSDNDQPQSLVVDGNDNLIIFGTTYSTNYPTTAGVYHSTLAGNGDIIISKLSSSGDALIASTYVGGTADDGLNTNPDFSTPGPLKYNYSDEARGEIIADNNNNYIVASCTKSSNFPVTSGALQPAFGGGSQDGILFKINSSLTNLDWSTFIGGSLDDAVYDCVLDSNSNLYVAGGTNSTDFPTTAGVLQPAYQGGSADGFIAHITSVGDSILAATYVGTQSYDQTYFVELDHNGNVYTTGQTEGTYPVTPGVYSNPHSKQFIHKMDGGLSATFYSTVFGNGSAFPNISPTAFLVDTCENVYVAGWGRCLNFGTFTFGDVTGMPVTNNAFQSTTDGCDFYFFVLNHDAISLLYATFYGGSFSEEHVDGGTSRFNKNGTIYESVCAGCGGNSDFPTTPGVVSNVNGSNNCNNGVIKLAFNLGLTVSSLTPTPAFGCTPFTTTFTNNSLNAVSYQWDFGDGSPIDTTFNPTHTFLDSGVYHVRLIAFNSSTCNRNDTSYSIITTRRPATLTAAYQVFPRPPCDTTATVQFSGMGGNNYEWDFGDGFVTSGLGASHTYTDTGTYTIRLVVTDSFCVNLADTVLQDVTFRARARGDAGVIGPASGCAPFLVTFINQSTPGGNHYWNFMDGSPLDTNFNQAHTFTAAGDYDVIFVIDDTSTCNVSDTAHVAIHVPFSIPLNADISVVSSPSCDTLKANMNYSGTGGQIYHWFFGDNQQGFGSDVQHSYNATGTYNIVMIVTDTVCNLLDTASRPVVFRPAVHAEVKSSVLSGCAPQSVDLRNTFSTTGTYAWSLGDGTFSTSPVIHHTYPNVGSYTIRLVVYDSTSCNKGDTSEYTLRVSPPPVAGFVFDKQEFYFMLNDIYFYDRSIDAAFYDWDFGDGTSAHDSVVAHKFTSGGSFDVCLRVTSSAGCIDTTCAPLDIHNSEMIYVPNVFTPNSDGTNDKFKVYYTGLTSVDVTIFNRWGQVIYEYTTLDGSWDGTYNGKPVIEDVYVWKLEATGVVSDNIVKYGRVSVVR